MADDTSEAKLVLSEDIEGSKEKTASNQTSSKQETKSSTIIQSPQISSQFAAHLNKRSCPESSQKEESFKRVKYSCEERKACTQSMRKQSKEKKELEMILNKKEEMLRKLKLVKMYRAKNNLSDLEDLIKKWRSICQQAAQDLYDKFSKECNTMSMGQFLEGMRVNQELIRYSEEEETFYEG